MLIYGRIDTVMFNSMEEVLLGMVLKEQDVSIMMIRS